MGLILVVPMARSKNRRAALTSRRRERNNVDDLAELVDRPLHVAPLAADLDTGLIHLPAVARRYVGTAEQPRPAASRPRARSG
jgi:hypothetical protein